MEMNERGYKIKGPGEMHYIVIPTGTSKVNSSRKKRYVWFYISFWYYYEATSKLHNDRSIVVVTIMWQEQAGDPKPGHNKKNPICLHNIPFPGMS